MSVLDPAGSDDGGPRLRCLDPAEPLPFEDCWLPFVEEASQRLRERSGAQYGLLSEEAHASLERWLLRRLADLAAPTLELELSISRSFARSPLDRLVSRPADEVYRRFTRRLLDGGLRPLLLEYGVLAQLLATATDLWVEAGAELLQRLATDWPRIRRAFAAAGEPERPRVVAIAPALSDAHHGGRTVSALTFSGGLKLVYKPRDLGVELAFFRLLAWIDRRAPALPGSGLLHLKVVRLLDRGTHGWMEHVEHRPCESLQAVRDYHRRAGMLLCLAYVLGGADFHVENVIAHGDQPVLIDLETLLHPRVEPDERSAAAGALSGAELRANRWLADSVLGSGLLPQWCCVPGDPRPHDVGGLGSINGAEMMVPWPSWLEVNTDAMRVEPRPSPVSRRSHLPRLGGDAVSLADHREEVVDGFRAMHRFLRGHREELLDPGGPLAGLACHPVRFVFRHTRVYAALLQRSLAPELLRDGRDRDRELATLGRGLLSTDRPHPFQPLVEEERRALERLDIPRFLAFPNGRDVMAAPEGEGGAPRPIAQGCFLETSFDVCQARLRGLCEEDLELQVSLVRAAFRALGEVHGPPAPAAAGDRGEAGSGDLLSAAAGLDRALEIADELCRRAVRGSDGSATWIGISCHPTTRRLHLQPLSHGLYDGVCGVALFLAACARVTGDGELRDLALAALLNLRPDRSRLASWPGAGAGHGAGSLMYALVRIGDLLGEPSLAGRATELSRRITAEALEELDCDDVLGGTAGELLGLLTLHQATGSPEALERAVACGRRLLRRRIVSGVGLRVWPTPEGRLLAGLSHGAAGIAYALARLHGATGEPAFLDAAREAVLWERSVFLPDEGIWPDLRRSADQTASGVPCAWCHGAAGIGLARLAGLDLLDGEAVWDDVEAALRATARYGLADLDPPCCGNLGRIELLFTAGRRLRRPGLVAAALRQAAVVVARAERGQGFRYGYFQGGHRWLPGFFQGASGIGYELLRLSFPDELPSVLSWQ